MACNRLQPTPVLAIAFAALLIARSASGSFIGVEDDRLIRAFCSGDEFPSPCAISQTAVPSTPFAPFDVTVGAPSPVIAAQDSVFTSAYLAGTGSISVHATPGDRDDARSLYDVTFDVPITTPYQLTGSLIWTHPPGVAEVTLYSGATVIFRPGTFPNFAHSGVFEPGQYRLVADLSIGGQGDYQDALYQFLLQTPEPHSALLLGLGLAIMACRRRTG